MEKRGGRIQAGANYSSRDVESDPSESANPINERSKENDMTQNRLYAMMDELGGMQIPLNPPRGRQQNKRLRDRGGVKGADFPEAFIVDEPLREIK